jgi:hypothetical protein
MSARPNATCSCLVGLAADADAGKTQRRSGCTYDAYDGILNRHVVWPTVAGKPSQLPRRVCAFTAK